MAPPLLGLHHVTATVADAQEDLDFCVGLLGLRLVKKTVNFDNHHVYHFYYGDEHGTPGTIWTTFPYKGWGVPVGTKGAGQIVATAFSVPSGSLGFWRDRLSARAVTVTDGTPRFGDAVIACADPSGLAFELVAGPDRREAWTGAGIGADAAVHGLHGITMLVRDPKPTIAFMTALLGWTVVDEMPGRIRLAVNGTQPGHLIDVAHDRNAPPARNGLGTVHHVAMAMGTEAEQLALRAELVAVGTGVTEVRDRQYFKSIYFREPGGVLFEVATMKPGFAVDEEPSALGRALKLPPWEEPHRAQIEQTLPQVTYR